MVFVRLRTRFVNIAVGQICKDAWRALREKYKRERGKMQKCRSGMAAVNPKKWSLFDIMTFIEPFLQSRK